MANATFGANILPKANANVTIGNSDSPWTIVSPSLTGTPTAPTAAAGTNTTQIATTAFVKNAAQVEEYANLEAFPATGAAGKIYIALDTNIIYRWDTTEYVPISSSGGSSPLHIITFSIATTDWFSVTGGYGARITNSNFIANSIEIIVYDNSIESNLNGNIDTSKDSTNHYIQFNTSAQPSGTISGTIYSLANPDGNVAIELINDVLGIDKGGTGANTASGARASLGLGTASTADVSNVLTETEAGKVLDARQGKALNDAISAINTSKAAVNGIATLDESGKVPSNQLPSYVDDVIEGYYYNSAFYSDAEHTSAITPETGKIYVDKTTNKSYRWSGTVYTELSSYAVATQSDAGLMSAADKTKLDGIAQSQLVDVPFSITTANWTLSNGYYQYELSNALFTATSKEIIQFDSSIRTAAQYDIDPVKSVGKITFKTLIQPTGTVNGSIYVLANESGNIVAIVGENVVPISAGGTNATTASGARTNLGLGSAAVTNIANNLTTSVEGYALDARQGKALSDHIAKYHEIDVSGQSNSTGAISTGITSSKYIVGYKVKSGNLEIQGFTAYGGAWFLQTTVNTTVDITVLYRDA